MAIFDFLKSSILSKVVMAATGVVLVLYIVGHMAGNLLVYSGPDAINAYAEFLHSTGKILWIVRIILATCFVLHVITSIRLYFLNRSTKPQKYKVFSPVKSTLASRTMIYGGITVFAFLLYHLAHFTIGSADPSIFGHIDKYGPGELFERHDAYYMIIMGFKSIPVSIFYIVAVIFLGFHLSHGIQSMFQTLGISGPNFTPTMIKFSNWFSVMIVIGYISIPITIMLGILGGEI